MSGFLKLLEGIREFRRGVQIRQVGGLQVGGQLVILRRRKVVEISFRQLPEEKSGPGGQFLVPGHSQLRTRGLGYLLIAQGLGPFQQSRRLPRRPELQGHLGQGELVRVTQVFKIIQRRIDIPEPVLDFTVRAGEIRQPSLNSAPEMLQHPLQPKVQPHSLDILTHFGFPVDEGVFNPVRIKVKMHPVFVLPPSVGL